MILKNNFITFPITSKKTPKIKGFTAITDSVKSGVFYGIQCGIRSNLNVIDIDTSNDGITKWNALCAANPAFNTVTIQTPSGGMHFYFKYKSGLKNLVKVNGLSLDVRTDGGFVCGFSSKGYKIISEPKVEMIDMPDWLFEFVKPAVFNQYNKECSANVPNMNRALELIDKDENEIHSIMSDTNGTCIVFKRVCSSHCEFCDKTHDNDNTEMTLICSNNNKIMKGCTRTPKQMSFLGFIDPNNVSTEPTEPEVFDSSKKSKNVESRLKINTSKVIDRDINIPKDIMVRSLGKTNKVILHNHQYCSNEPRLLDCKSDIIAIRSNTGTGKTNAVATMQKNNPMRLLVTTFRVGQVPQLKNDKFKDVDGLIAYNELDKDGNKVKLDNSVKAIICQAESLHRIKWTFPKKKKILTRCVFDEFLQFYKQFSSETFMKQPTVKASWKKFKQLVKYSDQIVIMDANLTPKIVEWVKEIRGDCTCNVFFNEYVNPNNRMIKVTDNAVDILSDIETKLKNNQRVYVACNGSIEKINAYAEIMRNAAHDLSKTNNVKSKKNILVIHRETLGNSVVKASLTDLNSSWGKYDGVIVSPSIQSGLSYDIKNSFNNIYGIFANFTNSSGDCLQMLDRIRHPTSNEIRVSITENNHSIGPIKQEDLMLSLKAKTAHMWDIQKSLAVMTDYEINGDGENQFVQNDFFKLWVDNTLSRNRDYMAFSYNFLMSERMAGFNLAYYKGMDDMLRKAYTKKIKAITEVQKTENAKLLAETIALSDLEIAGITDKLQAGKDVDQKELLALKKDVLLKTYIVDETTIPADIKDDWFKAYEKKQVRYNFRNQRKVFEFENFEDTLEHLEECEIKNFENATEPEDEPSVDHQQELGIVKVAATITTKFKFQKWKIALGWLSSLGFDKLNSNIEISKDDIKQKLIDIHGTVDTNEFEVLDKQKSKLDSFKNIAHDDDKFIKNMLQFINGPLTAEFGVSIGKQAKGKHTDKNYILKNKYLNTAVKMPRFTLKLVDDLYIPQLIVQKTEIAEEIIDMIDNNADPVDSDDD